MSYHINITDITAERTKKGIWVYEALAELYEFKGDFCLKYILLFVDGNSKAPWSFMAPEDTVQINNKWYPKSFIKSLKSFLIIFKNSPTNIKLVSYKVLTAKEGIEHCSNLPKQ